MQAEREARWRAWMIAGQAGDSASYENLLHELLPHVGRLVRRRLFDPTAAEDVVQNVFVSLHRARNTYRAERPFMPWLNAIARNACIDAMRERGRRGEREVSLELDGIPEPAGDASEPAEAPLDPNLRDAQREAVSLLHLADLSVAEAARRAGVSQSALKVRAHRGYRALHAILSAQEEEGA
jgi:RNA polymerase sigma-70 factor (ECF subfamily)